MHALEELLHAAGSLWVSFNCRNHRRKPLPVRSPAHDQVTRAADRKNMFLSERVVKIVHKVSECARSSTEPFFGERKQRSVLPFLLVLV